MFRRIAKIFIFIFIASCGDLLIQTGSVNDQGGPDLPLQVDWGQCPEEWSVKEITDSENLIIAKYCEPPAEPAVLKHVGDICPAGDFAEINSDGFSEVIKVAKGESIQKAINAAKEGALILISKGEFQEELTFQAPSRNLTLIGACSDETVISSFTEQAFDDDAVITAKYLKETVKITIKNISVTGEKAGISIKEKSQVILNGVIIDGVRTIGLIGSGTSVIEASQILVMNMRSKTADKTVGRAIEVHDNSKVSIKNSLIEKAITTGVLVAGCQNTGCLPEFTAENIFIINTLPQESDSMLGRGIDVQFNAKASLKNAIVSGNSVEGIYAEGCSNAACAVTLNGENIIIRNTQSQKSDGRLGRGIEIAANAKASLSKVLSEGNSEFGITLLGCDNSSCGILLNAGDVIVTNTKPNPEAGFGGGFVFQGQLTAKLERALIYNNFHSGALVQGCMSNACKTTVEFNDTAILDTLSQQSDKSFGRGINSVGNTSLTLNRMLIKNSREMGFSASGCDDKLCEAVITASNLTIKNTKIRECFEAGQTCLINPEASLGHGFGVYSNVSAYLKNTEITDNRNGIQIKDASVFTTGPCSLTTIAADKTVCLRLMRNNTAVNYMQLPDGYTLEGSLNSIYFEKNGTDYSQSEQSTPGSL